MKWKNGIKNTRKLKTCKKTASKKILHNPFISGVEIQEGVGVFLGRHFKPRSDSASYLDLQSVSITILKYSRKK